MTKAELIAKVAKTKASPGRDQEAGRQVIEAAFWELGDYFVKTKVGRRTVPRFTYPGFGTFTKKRARAHRTQPAQRRGHPDPRQHHRHLHSGQELRAHLNAATVDPRQPTPITAPSVPAPPRS